MRARILLVSVGLLVACESAMAQPQPQPQRSPVPPTPPAERSVEDLLTAIENLRAQKAELAKIESELTAALLKKLGTQNERVQKLGIAPKAAKAAEPDRVGRIIIEGNVKTPDKKILDLCDFRPGQVLQYPALDDTRAKLEKAGFTGATVEVVPSDLDSSFKDIRVRITEKGR